MSLLIENMINSRELSPAARNMSAADVLQAWVEANAAETVKLETLGVEEESLIGVLAFERDGDALSVLLNTFDNPVESSMEIFLIDPMMKGKGQYDSQGVWKGAKMLVAL